MADFQITIDCHDPDRLARFWSTALGYDLHEPPGNHETWKDYWLSHGVPEEEVEDGYDAVVDPSGQRPRLWFQEVPEAKTLKNRLHFDLLIGGGRSVPIATRKQIVQAEANRLVGEGASIRVVQDMPEYDHFAIGMSDPEGNEFDII